MYIYIYIYIYFYNYIMDIARNCALQGPINGVIHELGKTAVEIIRTRPIV